MTEPIPYASPARTSKHDVVYTALLGAVTFFILIAALEMEFLAHRPGQAPETEWILHLIFAIYLALLLFMAAVLLIRVAMPARRKWITLSLNIVLLIFFPFGRALAIYGLWKVDKNTSPPPAI